MPCDTVRMCCPYFYSDDLTSEFCMIPARLLPAATSRMILGLRPRLAVDSFASCSRANCSFSKSCSCWFETNCESTSRVTVRWVRTPPASISITKRTSPSCKVEREIITARSKPLPFMPTCCELGRCIFDEGFVVLIGIIKLVVPCAVECVLRVGIPPCLLDL